MICAASSTEARAEEIANLAKGGLHRRIDEFCDNRLSEVRQRLLHCGRSQDDTSDRGIDGALNRREQVIPCFPVCLCQFGIERLHLTDIFLVGELLLLSELLLGPYIVLCRIELLRVIGLVVRPFEVEEILLLANLFRSRNLAKRGLIIDRCFIVGEFRIGDLLIGFDLVELIVFALHGELLFELINIALDP